MEKPVRMFISVKDVDQSKFTVALAAYLKRSGRLEVKPFVDLVKLSAGNELCPADEDWYYVRCASILRHLYVRSPVGVRDFSKIFGGRKRNGSAPSHFCRAFRFPIRKAIHSLEKVNMVENHGNGGRMLTDEGRRILDVIAHQVYRKK